MTPRFVPFESMSDAEQREHLRRVHGWAISERERLANDTGYRSGIHQFDHVHLDRQCMPHTHDKPAPRPEENR